MQNSSLTGTNHTQSFRFSPIDVDNTTQEAASSFPEVPGHEILGKLGRGGMGVVYKARQTKLDRIVALKMIRTGVDPDEAELARFCDEAEAIARLQHPNIVQIFEIGEYEARPFISLEFCSGGSLDAKLQESVLPVEQAASLVETLARAMHETHRLNVIHRDLKPANVLLTENGSPKITDFGLAKKLDNEGKTQAGAIMGTPSYMAPEQAFGKIEDLGPACDVYALGGILYECLTGRPPFKAATMMETLDQVRSQEAVSPQELNTKVPRDLETICLKCLSKEPAKRYASAMSLAEDLKRFQKREPILARPVGHTERLWRWCRRNPPLAALIAIIVVLVVVGVAMVAWQWRKAVLARHDAELARHDAERNLYFRSIALAERSWSEKKFSRLDQILTSCQEDLRGWEWHCLFRLRHLNKPLIYAKHEKPREGREKKQRWPVFVVTFSPDGELAASAGDDKAVHLWQSQSGELERKIPTQDEGQIYSLSFSPNGRLLAGAAQQKKVVLWDVATGNRLRSFEGHTDVVVGVCFSPDGRHVASASDDRSVKIWDVKIGKCVQTLKGHEGMVNSVAYSPDGSRLASGGYDRTVKIWDVKNGTMVVTLQGHTNFVWGVAFSPNGNRVASASGDRTVRVWDIESKKTVFTLTGHTGAVWTVAFSETITNRIFSAGWDRSIKVWDATTGEEALTLSGHVDNVWCLAVHKKRLASASDDGTVRIWDGSKMQAPVVTGITTLSGHRGAVNSVAFSPDGKWLASASDDRTIKVWSTSTDRYVATLKGHTELVTSVTFSPDGRLIASASADKTIRLWDRRTHKQLAILEDQKKENDGRTTGHTDRVYRVVFSPDGEYLASGGWDYSVLVWKLTDENGNITPELLNTEFDHENWVWCVAFNNRIESPPRIVSASKDGTVRIWDLNSGTELRQRQMERRGQIHAVAFSPDDKWIASAGLDQTITLWDAETGKERATLRGEDGHTDRIYKVVFSREGRRLASASEDHTAKVWERKDGSMTMKLVSTFRGHNQTVNDVVFSPDGKRLASGSDDGTIKLWRVP